MYIYFLILVFSSGPTAFRPGYEIEPAIRTPGAYMTLESCQSAGKAETDKLLKETEYQYDTLCVESFYAPKENK